jgi:hypothetical protein
MCLIEEGCVDGMAILLPKDAPFASSTECWDTTWRGNDLPGLYPDCDATALTCGPAMEFSAPTFRGFTNHNPTPLVAGIQGTCDAGTAPEACVPGYYAGSDGGGPDGGSVQRCDCPGQIVADFVETGAPIVNFTLTFDTKVFTFM